MEKNNRKFKNLIINRDYQLRYTLFITFTGVCLVGMLGFISYSYLRENYMMLIELSPMTDAAREQLYGEMRDIILYLSIASLSFIAFVALTGLSMSHRVAGPMYHFHRIFSEIKNGNKEARVHLRPTDEFREVAQTFNEMMDDLTKKSPTT